LLLVLPRAEAAPRLAAIVAALEGTHHLAADVSDLRALFRLSGPLAREALARLVPADLHPDVFRPGELRRTRLAQIPCAVWPEEDGFRLLCFRSVAEYAQTILTGAAEAADRAGPVLFRHT
jgi:sarcosine oxidase subunit gamma